ncbi:MAG: hypothetical protein ACOWWO_12225 [Peptococcaceae bacterium]
MGWKYWSAVFISMIFFVSLIILGTNISAGRLAAITNQEITPPFLFVPVNRDLVQINILGSHYDYSLVRARQRYSNLKSSIQNSYVAVKCNLIPRADYLLLQWEKGVGQLQDDLKGVMNHF